MMGVSCGIRERVKNAALRGPSMLWTPSVTPIVRSPEQRDQCLSTVHLLPSLTNVLGYANPEHEGEFC